MKLFRTIILITGILVAGLAFNTAFAQIPSEKEEVSKEVKISKPQKIHVKKNIMHKALKMHKHEMKNKVRHEVDSELKKDLKDKRKAHKHVIKTRMKHEI